MPRKRFNRNAVASSRGSYVCRAHARMLSEAHDKNHQLVARLTIELQCPPKYFVKCFGKLLRITERQAMMLGLRNPHVITK